jgi:hypothetical protein
LASLAARCGVGSPCNRLNNLRSRHATGRKAPPDWPAVADGCNPDATSSYNIDNSKIVPTLRVFRPRRNAIARTGGNNQPCGDGMATWT